MPATLSQIHAWSTEHLIDAAAYWTQTADRWEDAFLTMRNQAQSITWHGAGGDALRQRTGADVSVVTGKADLLRQAAGIARNGASDISAAQRRVLYGVEDAQNAGFAVGEDLSVTDTRSTSPAERATRQAQAEAFAADIRLRAEQLDGADTKVSGQLTAATAGLTGGGFAPAQGGSNRSAPADNRTAPGSNHNGVKLVDFKQDGGPQPQPQPGLPQPGQQPSFMDQYERQLTSAGPQSQPPVTPMPAFGKPPDPGPQPAPGPMPTVTPPPSFGQCVEGKVKANIGKDMIKSGYETAIKGAIGGAVGGGVITPEIGGAGAIPGAVLGFVGGFAKGLLEAPVKAAVEGAVECAVDPIPGVP
ncbi:hypothetical protein [Mycobacterium intracellulare]|uniref:hypothetical protein n=1 Tax=Mycobacterium intracellulare TaxID=1767 RepID=UPI001EED2742|nr:hypothetical protein [Mycobacterium intracellulare]MEE3753418.1 hypothetical protein [Mycobacterium intracellulare]